MTTAKAELQHLRTELEKWQLAVMNCRSTIQFLEDRGDAKNTRIRELESKVRDLGGTP